MIHAGSHQRVPIIVACLRQGRPFLDFLIRGLLLPSKYISKEGTQDFVGHRADLFKKCLDNWDVDLPLSFQTAKMPKRFRCNHTKCKPVLSVSCTVVHTVLNTCPVHYTLVQSLLQTH